MCIQSSFTILSMFGIFNVIWYVENHTHLEETIRHGNTSNRHWWKKLNHWNFILWDFLCLSEFLSNEILTRNQENVFLKRIRVWVENISVGDGDCSCVTPITQLFEVVSSLTSRDGPSSDTGCVLLKETCVFPGNLRTQVPTQALRSVVPVANVTNSSWRNGSGQLKRRWLSHCMEGTWAG